MRPSCEDLVDRTPQMAASDKADCEPVGMTNRNVNGDSSPNDSLSPVGTLKSGDLSPLGSKVAENKGKQSATYATPWILRKFDLPTNQ